MFRSQTHTHPRNPNEVVYGQRLEDHDPIEADDVYADSNGVWRPCGTNLIGQAPGVMYVVRPAARPTSATSV